MIKTKDEATKAVRLLKLHQIARKAKNSGVILGGKSFNITDDNAPMIRKILKALIIQKFPSADVALKYGGVYIGIIPAHLEIIKVLGSPNYEHRETRALLCEKPRIAALYQTLSTAMSRARGIVDLCRTPDGAGHMLIARCSLPNLRGYGGSENLCLRIIGYIDEIKTAINELVALIVDIPTEIQSCMEIREARLRAEREAAGTIINNIVATILGLPTDTTVTASVSEVPRDAETSVVTQIITDDMDTMNIGDLIPAGVTLPELGRAEDRVEVRETTINDAVEQAFNPAVAERPTRNVHMLDTELRPVDIAPINFADLEMRMVDPLSFSRDPETSIEQTTPADENEQAELDRIMREMMGNGN